MGQGDGGTGEPVGASVRTHAHGSVSDEPVDHGNEAALANGLLAPRMYYRHASWPARYVSSPLSRTSDSDVRLSSK
jgi:hypothetical protein